MRWLSLFDISNNDHKKYLIKLMNKLIDETIQNKISWHYDCSNALSTESYKSNELILTGTTLTFKISRIYSNTNNRHYYSLSCIGYKGININLSSGLFNLSFSEFNNRECILVITPQSILPEIEVLFNTVSNKGKYKQLDSDNFYINYLSAYCPK